MDWQSLTDEQLALAIEAAQIKVKQYQEQLASAESLLKKLNRIRLSRHMATMRADLLARRKDKQS